jgi:release factor glutamine methyltransferase
LTIRTALLQGTQLLDEGGIIAPRLTAEVLLCHALRRERVYLFAHPEQELRQVEWLHYGRYLHERLKHKPTQYITRRQEFYGREFRVTPAVLIPRPETEHLVEAALPYCQPGKTVVDVGTGSGAIAITLALETRSRVFAVDLSAEALEVARDNADRLQARLGFFQGDLLSAVSRADVIVSNPPYVPETERPGMQPEVRDYEPELALFGGDTGNDIYARLIPEAAHVLRPGGQLLMEIGIGNRDAVLGMFHDGWRPAEVIPDLAGLPRVVHASSVE